MNEIEHFDVIVVGAGISGIGAAVHLQRRCPTRSVAILEARANIGGTWDLFRYQGIRSDSDMHAGIQLQAMDAGEGNCRRPVDTQISR